MAEPAGRADSAITPEVEELIMKMSDAGISYRVIADRIGRAHSTVSNRITQIRQRRKQAESEWLQESVSWCAAWAAAERCSKAKTAALTGSAIGANSGIRNTRAEWPRTFNSTVGGRGMAAIDAHGLGDLMDGDGLYCCGASPCA